MFFLPNFLLMQCCEKVLLYIVRFFILLQDFRFHFLGKISMNLNHWASIFEVPLYLIIIDRISDSCGSKLLTSYLKITSYINICLKYHYFLLGLLNYSINSYNC
jgi:hypothetical protein